MIFLLLLLALSAQADDSCKLLQVEEVEGNVTFRAASGEELPLSAEDSLEAGESVITSARSWADLRHCDGTAQRVGENTEFTFEESEGEGDAWTWAFSLLRGSLRALVNGAGEGDKMKFRLRTRTASIGVRGTEFVVEAGEAETSLHTLEGEVLMGSASDFGKLRAFQASHMARFRRVRKERFSRVRSGGRATLPQQFSPVRFRKERGQHLFRREMRRTQGFRSLVPGKKARAVFQRNSSAIQRRMENKRRQNPGMNRRQNQGQRLQQRPARERRQSGPQPRGGAQRRTAPAGRSRPGR